MPSGKPNNRQSICCFYIFQWEDIAASKSIERLCWTVEGLRIWKKIRKNHRRVCSQVLVSYMLWVLFIFWQFCLLLKQATPIVKLVLIFEFIYFISSIFAFDCAYYWLSNVKQFRTSPGNDLIPRAWRGSVSMSLFQYYLDISISGTTKIMTQNQNDFQCFYEIYVPRLGGNWGHSMIQNALCDRSMMEANKNMAFYNRGDAKFPGRDNMGWKYLFPSKNTLQYHLLLTE